MFRALCTCVPFFALTSWAQCSERITEHVVFEPGPINSVLIEDQGATAAIYGASNDSSIRVEQLLLTHHRRDAVWPALETNRLPYTLVAPEAEREWLEKPGDFWRSFVKSRFHDYGCFTSKIIANPIKVDRWVRDGDHIDWHGHRIDVLATPGFTRGSLSYAISIDGKKIVCTGDLIYGDGKILDLVSFQDAIASAEIRGYHGYGSRLGELMTSLQKVADLRADVILPARGPAILDPATAIAKLQSRVKALYQNYLSTNALHWYFREDRMRKCGERILGSRDAVELMPFSHHEKAPDWIIENATSRILVSDNGHAFLIDCGYQRVIDAIDKMIESGLIKKIDGIFVTHYHDDHTDMVQAAAEKFACPVYAVQEYVDILAHPERYRMPAMTAAGIKDIVGVSDGHAMKWNEFDFTFHFFPGQALYHGAMLVRKESQKPVYFVGDSFAPSGMDDYCVQNRNLVERGQGYQLCLEKLRSLNEPVWLVNEHIPFVFQFSPTEIEYLETRYKKRTEILRELFPWDSPNYGIDEHWASFYPYGSVATRSSDLDLEFRVVNHSPIPREFKISLHAPSGLTLSPAEGRLELAAGSEGTIKTRVKVGSVTGPQVVTADIQSPGMDLRRWAEALVNVE